MKPNGGYVSENIQALVLFYLFERACAGFIRWGFDGGSPDRGYQDYLIGAARTVREKVAAAADRGFVPTTPGEDVFDTGLMPNNICDYLQRKIAASAAVPLLAHTDPPLKPARFRDRLNTFTQLRNKVMHGQRASLPPDEIAAKLCELFQDFRSIMSPRTVGKDENPELAVIDLSKLTSDGRLTRGIDHTSWARLLFLTTEELLWIASGRVLPIADERLADANGAAASDGAAFLHRQGELKTRLRGHELRLLRTLYVPAGASSGAATNRLYGGDYRSIWVAMQPTATAQSGAVIGSITNYLRTTYGCGDSEFSLVLDGVSEGPCDAKSDPMNIPWWRAAAAGECFIRIALK